MFINGRKYLLVVCFFFLSGAYHLLISHLVPKRIHNDLQRDVQLTVENRKR